MFRKKQEDEEKYSVDRTKHFDDILFLLHTTGYNLSETFLLMWLTAHDIPTEVCLPFVVYSVVFRRRFCHHLVCCFCSGKSASTVVLLCSLAFANLSFYLIFSAIIEFIHFLAGFSFNLQK